MKSRLAFIAAIAVLLAGSAQAQEFNAKSVDSMTLRITQSGELLVDGYVKAANLTLYIPQYGVRELKVGSNYRNSWHYASDAFGNRVAVIEWERPAGIVTYSVDMLVDNGARFSRSSGGVGNDPSFTAETQSIVIDDGIRKAAYAYEKTWEGVAGMTAFVNDIVDYDISMKGDRKPSDWVLENRRGVCVEHANLLAALLRARGIPARYIVGYAYSSVENRLIGHTWVEVLDSSGDWIPFDPTWMQGGYLDATHIKTASLLDDNQSDRLSYIGSGTITWKQNGDSAESAEILGYTTRNVTSIMLSASNATKGGYGYVKASVSPIMCTIIQVEAQSCVDASDSPALEFYDRKRNEYACGEKDVYWFFRERGSKNSYICPVTVFDQTGSAEDISVASMPPDSEARNIWIDGPDTASPGEQFTLYANAGEDFIFYSPDFGRNYGSSWALSIRRPGTYAFYLYSGGSLSTKTVSVVEEKEFDMLVSAPSAAGWNEIIYVNVTVRNAGKPGYALLSVEFNGLSKDARAYFGENEEKKFSVGIQALQSGALHVSVSGNSMATYSKFIDVAPRKNASFLDSIMKAISDFFRFLAGI